MKHFGRRCCHSTLTVQHFSMFESHIFLWVTLLVKFNCHVLFPFYTVLLFHLKLVQLLLLFIYLLLLFFGGVLFRFCFAINCFIYLNFETIILQYSITIAKLTEVYIAHFLYLCTVEISSLWSMYYIHCIFKL